MKCQRFVVIAFWAFLILPAYTATTVEDPMEFHALTELAQRQGWRRTHVAGTYQDADIQRRQDRRHR